MAVVVSFWVFALTLRWSRGVLRPDLNSSVNRKDGRGDGGEEDLNGDLLPGTDGPGTALLGHDSGLLCDIRSFEING